MKMSYEGEDQGESYMRIGRTRCPSWSGHLSGHSVTRRQSGGHSSYGGERCREGGEYC